MGGLRGCTPYFPLPSVSHCSVMHHFNRSVDTELNIVPMEHIEGGHMTLSPTFVNCFRPGKDQVRLRVT